MREYHGVANGDYLSTYDRANKIDHIFNWVHSFVTGMALWVHVDTKKPELLEWAKQFKDDYYNKVFNTPMETMHDLGFLYSPYAVMMYNITGDED